MHNICAEPFHKSRFQRKWVIDVVFVFCLTRWKCEYCQFPCMSIDGSNEATRQHVSHGNSVRKMLFFFFLSFMCLRVALLLLADSNGYMSDWAWLPIPLRWIRRHAQCTHNHQNDKGNSAKRIIIICLRLNKFPLHWHERNGIVGRNEQQLGSKSVIVGTLSLKLSRWSATNLLAWRREMERKIHLP